MTRVMLEGITKYFGKVIAVDNVYLNVEKGELFTILGPSGCGKTTTLRIIAGFELPDKGKLYFDDEDVTYLKPYKRGAVMVFQNYALWPHMTVYENIAYGLRVKRKELGLSERDIKERIEWVLELVKLKGLENRYPLQLSGGQQQRVALARALVVQPRVLLLDEPLSNLDARLRIEMREEFRRIQRELKITTIYVTHDQAEAMSISDRIAIMDKGKVIQVGTPQELYFKPKHLFVADFLGRSNIYRGEVVGREKNIVMVRIEDLHNVVIKGITPFEDKPSSRIAVVIRPEIIKYGEHAREDHVVLRGVVESAMFIGDRIEARIRIGKLSLVAYFPNTLNVTIGQEIVFSIPWRNVIILPL
ncbi:MAG: ABC transporter ATP-binding protein [Desulfurococcaceae archaeon]